MKKHQQDIELDDPLKDLESHKMWNKQQKQQLKNRILMDLENLESNDRKRNSILLTNSKKVGLARKLAYSSLALIVLLGFTIGTAYVSPAFANTLKSIPIFSSIFGTPEDAKENYGIVKQEYNDWYELFEVARKSLSSDEFEKFTVLWEKYAELNKKTIIVNGERTYRSSHNLTKEELKEYDEVFQELDPYLDRIYNQFTYTMGEAQKLVSFPINHPTYLPVGYALDEEEARADVTSGKPQPIIKMTYKKQNADESEAMAYWTFTIQMQENLKEKLIPYVDNIDAFEREHDHIHYSNYTLDGYKFTLMENEGGNIIGLRIIVPAKEGRSAYQMFIANSALPKEELEKVLLSMVEK